jgi:cytochrome P450
VVCAAFYHLLKTPGALCLLQDEIRGSFCTIEEITADNLTTLPYLTAVIKEALRIMPPVAMGLPRYSPGAFIDGYYIPKGVSSQLLCA